jgi:hypothetical protein
MGPNKDFCVVSEFFSAALARQLLGVELAGHRPRSKNSLVGLHCRECNVGNPAF